MVRRVEDQARRASSPGFVRLRAAALVLLLMTALVSAGCARLPYATQVIHEDGRISVTLQREIRPAGYAHPVLLQHDEIAALLAGYSFREQQSLPLRWFAEEIEPKPLFRPDEIEALVPFIAEALGKAGPDERIAFRLMARGMSPYDRATTAGWVAVRDRYFHLTLEHFQAQFPIRKEEQWDNRYPSFPPEPKAFLLYFEPGRFWKTDQVTGLQAVEYREFLKYAPTPSAK